MDALKITEVSFNDEGGVTVYLEQTEDAGEVNWQVLEIAARMILESLPAVIRRDLFVKAEEMPS